jgi:hypothetical protein
MRLPREAARYIRYAATSDSGIPGMDHDREQFGAIFAHFCTS